MTSSALHRRASVEARILDAMTLLPVDEACHLLQTQVGDPAAVDAGHDRRLGGDPPAPRWSRDVSDLSVRWGARTDFRRRSKNPEVAATAQDRSGALPLADERACRFGAAPVARFGHADDDSLAAFARAIEPGRRG